LQKLNGIPNKFLRDIKDTHEDEDDEFEDGDEKGSGGEFDDEMWDVPMLMLLD
jgi:hypothetical protein